MTGCWKPVKISARPSFSSHLMDCSQTIRGLTFVLRGQVASWGPFWGGCKVAEVRPQNSTCSTACRDVDIASTDTQPEFDEWVPGPQNNISCCCCCAVKTKNPSYLQIMAQQNRNVSMSPDSQVIFDGTSD